MILIDTIPPIVLLHLTAMAATSPSPWHNVAAPFIDNPTETLSPGLLGPGVARRRRWRPTLHLRKGLLSDSTLTTRLYCRFEGSLVDFAFAPLQISEQVGVVICSEVF